MSVGNGGRETGREWRERWLRFPSGERVPLFSEHIADDKTGLMNRDTAADTLLGGPGEFVTH